MSRGGGARHCWGGTRMPTMNNVGSAGYPANFLPFAGGGGLLSQSPVRPQFPLNTPHSLASRGPRGIAYTPPPIRCISYHAILSAPGFVGGLGLQPYH